MTKTFEEMSADIDQAATTVEEELKSAKNAADFSEDQMDYIVCYILKYRNKQKYLSDRAQSFLYTALSIVSSDSRRSDFLLNMAKRDIEKALEHLKEIGETK